MASLGVTEAGCSGGWWPWGWGQPGLGLQGWDVGEGQAGASVGREEARTLEGPPGSKPPESKKPGGHSCHPVA